MASNHTSRGWNQYTDFVKGVTGASLSLPGIAVGDKIVRVSRHRLAGTTGNGFLGSNAVLTAAQFSVSAANTIAYSGSSGSFPRMLLCVTWVDMDGDQNGV